MGEKILNQITDWIHENPNDKIQIQNRAMIVAGSLQFRPNL